MLWIIGAIIFIALLVIIVSLSMLVLVSDTAIIRHSRSTLNKFEPDNTAPKLTDMINYHTSHEESKYMI